MMAAVLCIVPENGVACEVCGKVLRAGVRRRCPGAAPRGLGDRVADTLALAGITKERVEAVLGGPCGCDQRQEALNDLGRKIGLG